MESYACIYLLYHSRQFFSVSVLLECVLTVVAPPCSSLICVFSIRFILDRYASLLSIFFRYSCITGLSMLCQINIPSTIRDAIDSVEITSWSDGGLYCCLL